MQGGLLAIVPALYVSGCYSCASKTCIECSSCSSREACQHVDEYEVEDDYDRYELLVNMSTPDDVDSLPITLLLHNATLFSKSRSDLSRSLPIFTNMCAHQQDENARARNRCKEGVLGRRQAVCRSSPLRCAFLAGC